MAYEGFSSLLDRIRFPTSLPSIRCAGMCYIWKTPRPSPLEIIKLTLDIPVYRFPDSPSSNAFIRHMEGLYDDLIRHRKYGDRFSLAPFQPAENLEDIQKRVGTRLEEIHAMSPLLEYTDPTHYRDIVECSLRIQECTKILTRFHTFPFSGQSAGSLQFQARSLDELDACLEDHYNRLGWAICGRGG